MLNSCPLIDNGTRFNCLRASPSYVEPGADAFLDTRVQLTRRYILVGDSVTEQFARGLACFGGCLSPRAPHLVHGITVGNNGTKPRRYTFAMDCHQHCEGGASDAQVCLIRPKEIYAAGVATVCAALLPELRRGDVLLINEGVWWRAKSRSLEVELSHLVPFTSEFVARFRAKGVRLVWRETLAQHFRSDTGQWSNWYQRTKLSCLPVKNASGLLERTDAVNRVMRAAGVDVLPAFNLSLTYWDAHLQRRTPYMQAKPTSDCTHFCEPSTLFARLSAALVRLTEEPGRGDRRHPAHRDRRHAPAHGG